MAPPHLRNEPQTSKRRSQALASSQHINLNDLLASSFFKRRRRADFFLPSPWDCRVASSAPLNVGFFLSLFHSFPSHLSRPRFPFPSIYSEIHSNFDALLESFLLVSRKHTVIIERLFQDWTKSCRVCAICLGRFKAIVFHGSLPTAKYIVLLVLPERVVDTARPVQVV